MAALSFLEATVADSVLKEMERSKTVAGRVMRYGPTGAMTPNYTNAHPIHRYDLVPGIKRIEEFQDIEALWYVMHFGTSGPYKGFLIRDWHDYHLTDANSRLTLISGSTYQINRVHAYLGGSVEFIRPIYKPDSGVVIRRLRTGVYSTASATVDLTTGQAIISGHAGGDTYTAVGTFRMPVTFSSNEWTASIESLGRQEFIAVSGSIPIEEVRL